MILDALITEFIRDMKHLGRNGIVGPTSPASPLSFTANSSPHRLAGFYWDLCGLEREAYV